jgi:hypothetical protein
MTCQIKIKGFYVKKNWKSYPENWKIGEKLKVIFCDGYALFFFFCFVRYSREKVFRKKKSGQTYSKFSKSWKSMTTFLHLPN